MTTLELIDGRLGESRFYVWLSGAMALFAFVAFAPTYWLQLPTGAFTGPAILHLHGVLFSAWTLLVTGQAWLAWTGDRRTHRALGLAGVALASLMMAVGLATAVARLHEAEAAGWGEAARGFMVVQVSGLVLFGGLVAAAIAMARRRDWHFRLILAATASLMQAPMGRIPFLIQHGIAPGQSPSDFAPPPVSLIVFPELAVNLFLVAGLIHDLKTRGRPHPAWIVGLASIAIVTLLRWPLSTSPGWLATADWLGRIAG
jgi:hypothetical protein